MRVMLSTYTTRAPRRRPIQANGTATPAPVVSITCGFSAPDDAPRQTEVANQVRHVRFVGPKAWTTCSSVEQRLRVALVECDPDAREALPRPAKRDELEEMPPVEQTRRIFGTPTIPRLDRHGS